jgi:hypothetical protein
MTSEEDAKKLAKEMMNAWDKQVQSMKEKSEAIDWSGADWSKLKPKDIGVTFGPPMTEEQFAEYRKNKAVKVIKKK